VCSSLLRHQRMTRLELLQKPSPRFGRDCRWHVMYRKQATQTFFSNFCDPKTIPNCG
jgi:hypothetical protein